MSYGMRFATLYRRQGSRPSPRKAKWLSVEALQIAVKRREVKSKGEKDRYTHLNAEFQRIARRDKKAFLSNQCEETEENNRMGKTRDLFKKIRDTKGLFHAKIKNSVDIIVKNDFFNPLHDILGICESRTFFGNKIKNLFVTNN